MHDQKKKEKPTSGYIVLSALVKIHPGYCSSTGGPPDQSDQVQNAYRGDGTWTEPTEDSWSCNFSSHPEHSLWAQAHLHLCPSCFCCGPLNFNPFLDARDPSLCVPCLSSPGHRFQLLCLELAGSSIPSRPFVSHIGYRLSAHVLLLICAGSQHGRSHPWQGHAGLEGIPGPSDPWQGHAEESWWARPQDSTDPLDLLEHLPPRTRICLSYYFMSFTSSSDISRGLSLTKRVNLGL